MTVADSSTRTDPEDPLAIPAAPIVEWFRVDASRRIVKWLAIGATGMLAGSVAIARLVVRTPHALQYASRSPTRDPGAWSAAALGESTAAWTLLGFALVVGCGLAAVLGLRRVLSEESYLALRVDGLLFVDGQAQRRYARWEDVADVRHDLARSALVVELASGEPWVISATLAGATHAEIARRAAAVRRRALFGLYRR